MAKFVRVAAISYSTFGDYSRPVALRQTILRETRERLDRLRGFGIQLVVTAENVGYYTCDAKQPESLETPGELMSIYAEFARSEHCHVAGSVVLHERDGKFNALVLFDDRGAVAGCYRKNFLTFGPGAELELGFCPGDDIACVDTAVGRIGLAICFDLNFPELRARYKAARPDILCFSSMYHGGLMQSMWAYDLRSFLIAALPLVNAPFGIMDPFGREVRFASSYVPDPVADINLDRVMMHLTWNQAKFADIIRKYGNEVTLAIPPSIGPALLYSNSPDRSAAEIAREFELVLLDDFLELAREANATARRIRNGSSAGESRGAGSAGV